MMEPSEAYTYAKLCRTLNKTSELPTFPIPDRALSSAKEPVILAREVEALALRRRRTTNAISWREKAAKEMDILIDDDDVPVQNLEPAIDKELNAKKKRLETLLSKPFFPKGFSFKFPTLNEPKEQESNLNALQVMKRAIETGELKKEKRKSKNEPLLKLQKMFKK